MTRKSKQAKPTYTREELIAASIAFGVKPEVMAGALRLAGKQKYTKDEAIQAVRAYLERRV